MSKKGFVSAPLDSSQDSNPFSFAKFVRQREFKDCKNGYTFPETRGISISDDSDVDLLDGDSLAKSAENGHDSRLFGDTLEDSFDMKGMLEKLSVSDGEDGNMNQIKSEPLQGFKRGSAKETNLKVLRIVNDETPDSNRNPPGQSSYVKQEISSSSDSELDDKKNDDSPCVSPLSAAYILPSSSSLTGSELNLLRSDLYQLEQENTHLRHEVDQLKVDMMDERLKAKKRIEDLLNAVQAAKRKEAEETAALERVVQMVEENLEKTTRRAVKAEATVARLKEELKALKETAVPRSLYNTVVEEYEHTLCSVRAKSQEAAETMRKAASEAEPVIRTLLGGLQSLRCIAEQFDDIDRITEVSQHQT